MKTAKRILVLVLVMVMALTALPLTASADSIVDTAISMKSGIEYSKMLNCYSKGENADYKIVVTSSGTLTVNLTSTTKYIDLCLYDSNFSEIDVATTFVSTGELERGGVGRTWVGYYWNDVSETSVSKTTWNVDKGTYYLRINNSADSYGYMCTDGKIAVKATYPSTTATKAKISYISVTMSKGSTLQLGAVVSPSNSKVTWKSSKTSVATISSSGKITAKAKGATIITAKSGSSTKKIRIVVK